MPRGRVKAVPSERHGDGEQQTSRLTAIYHTPCLQRILRHNRYEPIWHMMQKVRMLMGKSGSGFLLQGGIESDGASLYVQGPKGLTKGGKEQRAKAKILFSVEAEPVDASTKYKINKKIGKLKMAVLANFSAKEVENAIKCHISQDASVTTDDHKSFHGMEEWVREHNGMW